MWVLARFGFAALVFLFRALWRRQGLDQSVIYRDTQRVTLARHKTIGPRHDRQRVISKIYWGLALRTPLVFALTREGWWDRICTFLGISQELQTGDAQFDRKIYVAGDHPALHALLTEDPQLRERILRLFEKGAVRIFCDGRHLWVESEDLAYPSDQALDTLHGIYLALKHGGPTRGHWLLDRFLWKAILVEALVWSLALYGAPAFVESLYREYVRGESQRYLDLWALARPALQVAAATFVAIFGLVILILHGSSRGHRILLESFLVLAIGLPLSAMEVVSDINLSANTSAPQTYDYRVVSRWDTDTKRTDRRRGLVSHFLRLAPATPGAPRAWPYLQVPAGLYHQTKTNSLVKVTLQTGRLGIPWIVRVDAVTSIP